MGERVAPHVKTPSLNNELHHDLLSLINLPKLKEQETRPCNANNPALSIAIKQNITNVNQLDNWLKYYFPNGCDWADTPS